MVIRRALWHAHPHVRSGSELTLGERAADILKRSFGTWSALGLVAVVIAGWMTAQTINGVAWDSYPYILLNLVLSCLAAVQGIILQISANRGDRISSELAMHTFENGQKILEINRAQSKLLDEIHALQKQLAQLRDGKS
jgi:uncharacterized membrane protein